MASAAPAGSSGPAPPWSSSSTWSASADRTHPRLGRLGPPRADGSRPGPVPGRDHGQRVHGLWVHGLWVHGLRERGTPGVTAGGGVGVAGNSPGVDVVPAVVKVEIWSDVVCPWGFIGKRRFETSLSRFEHAADVEVVWPSLQLEPSVAEGDVHPTLPALAAEYGRSEDEMRAQMTHIDTRAAEEGLDHHLADGVSGNTLLAHQLIHLAAEHGLQDAMKERLLHAHFEEQRPVFDADALVALGAEVGLDTDEARAALTDRRFPPAVQDDIATARALGATGVPFFVVDRTYGAAGAQPAEQLLAILDRAWADSQPVLTTVPAAGG